MQLRGMRTGLGRWSRKRARIVAAMLFIAFASLGDPTAHAAAAGKATAANSHGTDSSRGQDLHLTIGVEGSTGGWGGGSAAVQMTRAPNCTGADALQESVSIPVGKSTMMSFSQPVRTRTVGNPSVVEAALVSPQTLYLLGMTVGTTNMIVQGRNGSCTVVDVIVGLDPSGLQRTLASLMPEEHDVVVKSAADTIILAGTVSDTVQAERIVEIAHAFLSRATTPVASAPSNGGTANVAAVADSGQDNRVINMMSVAAPQQVMLEVKVAEVSKTLIDELGVQPNISGGIGSWSVGLAGSFLSGGLGTLAISKSNNLPLNATFDAQKTDELYKILAEPNLVAISGQEASFLAGGRVFIPVPQSSTGSSTTITLQEEKYGVGLTFTPTVLRGGRINLKVAPEVSELSSTGAVVSTGSSTAVMPLITTRRASTTLQLNDGQSLAIGGLLKNNVTGSVKGIPGIGELPILGALFRSTSYQNDKTELVFVVTPHLVKPLPTNYPLPTDHFGEVNQGSLYLHGNMEGRPAHSKSDSDSADGIRPSPLQLQTPLTGNRSSESVVGKPTEVAEQFPEKRSDDAGGVATNAVVVAVPNADMTNSRSIDSPAGISRHSLPGK